MSKLILNVVVDVLLGAVAGALALLLVRDVCPSASFFHIWLACVGVRQLLGTVPASL